MYTLHELKDELKGHAVGVGHGQHGYDRVSALHLDTYFLAGK